MNTQSDLEKFHSVSALDQDELNSRYGEDLTAWLEAFVRDQLVGVELPAIDTLERFADAIRMLADNKRAWSQRLGTLILDQVDGQNPSENTAAGEKLREFSQTSPWKFLRQSAATKIA